MVWSDPVWSGLVWSGLVWHGLVWPGLASPGLAQLLIGFRLVAIRSEKKWDNQTNDRLNKKHPGFRAISAGLDWVGMGWHSAEPSNKLEFIGAQLSLAEFLLNFYLIAATLLLNCN